MRSCDTCAATVCGFDSYCCTVYWDSICVWEAEASCTVATPPAVPTNNTTASVLTSSSGTVTGSTVYASNDTTAVVAEGAGSGDVVYSMTLTSATTVYLDTAGSTYDTAIYVQDSNATTVASNDDASADTTSAALAVTLAAGTYQVIVDGYSTSSTGTYVLSYSK